MDGAAYDSSTPYVESVAGDVGSFTYQAQIETGAAAMFRQMGVDVVTGSGDPYTHTGVTGGNANPIYQTIREKSGVSVGPMRLVWWDAIYNDLTLNCGNDQNVMHMACAIQALKAAEIGSLTDPVAVDSGTDPWRWGESTGAMTIDSGSGAVAFANDVIGETLHMSRNWTTQPGDNITPGFFVPGRGGIDRTFDAAVTDTMLPQYKRALWGSVTPTVGTLPTSQPVFVGLASLYTRSGTRTLSLATPKVEVKPDDIMFGTKPQGGLTRIAFGGRALASGSPQMTVIALTSQSTTYIV